METINAEKDFQTCAKLFLNTITVELTKRAYASDLEKAMAFFGNINPEDITPLKLADYTTEKLSGYSLSYQNRQKSTLRKFFQFLGQMGLLNSHIGENIRLRRVRTSYNRGLMDNDSIRRLLSKTYRTSIRNGFLFSLLYHTGIRCAELASLSVGDIRHKKQLEIIGKGRICRIVPLVGDALHKEIERYLEYRGECDDAEPLFVSSRKTRLSKAQILNICNRHAGVSPHAFRHSAASHWLKSGIDLFSVSQLLGHADLNTTAIYTHVTVDDLAESLHRAA